MGSVAEKEGLCASQTSESVLRISCLGRCLAHGTLSLLYREYIYVPGYTSTDADADIVITICTIQL